jgi:hypothetical protein
MLAAEKANSQATGQNLATEVTEVIEKRNIH